MNAAALETLNLTDWRVNTEVSLSDNRYIEFNLGRYTPNEPNYRNLHKADWPQFAMALEKVSKSSDDDTRGPPSIRSPGLYLGHPLTYKVEFACV